MWMRSSRKRQYDRRRVAGRVMHVAALCLIVCMSFPLLCSAGAEEMTLPQLVSEALSNNPDLHAARFKSEGSGYRIPQVQSLPDPLFTFGYQNEGFRKYTYGQSEDSQWSFSASQAIPFPGKLSLKGEAAERESESLSAAHESLRLKIISRVKETYFDLYSTYKTIDLIGERNSLFSRVEEAALARYSAGKGSQIDVLLAQTEKYLLVERQEMLNQKLRSLEAQLGSAVGRMSNAPFSRPAECSPTDFNYSADDLIRIADDQSPDLKARDNTIKAAEARVSFAKKDYIPDFTVTGAYTSRGNGFGDMWSLATTINIPIFYRTKQRHAVNEANAALMEARSDRESARLAIATSIRDNCAILSASNKLMSLYRDGLIPKSRQDIELSLSAYSTGSIDATTVIGKLKSVIDFEISYWVQFAEHEKAAARLEAAAGLDGTSMGKLTGNGQ